MSERTDHLTDDVIAQFLRARAADAELGLLDDIVRAVGATPQDRPWLGLRPMRLTGRTLLIVAALLLATIGALAVGSGLLLPKPNLGIFEPVAGRIVYGFEGFGDETTGVYGIEDGIWGLDPDASDSATPVRLTSELGTPIGWSADGTQLLIQRGAEDLWLLHADGSETLLAEQPWGLYGATISPDGTRVAFGGLTQPESEYGGLFAVDADGGPAELLWEWAEPTDSLIVRSPTFSPDGTQLAFVLDNIDSNHSVWVIDADGTDARQILTSDDLPFGAGWVRGLAWSPAGDRIALAMEGVEDPDPTFRSGIYTFAPDGSGFTRLGDTGPTMMIGGSGLYWAPDGQQLAYTTGCNGANAAGQITGCMLVIADADGSVARTFLNGLAGPWHPGTPSPSVTSTVEEPPSVDATTPASPGPTSSPGLQSPQPSLDEVPEGEEPVPVEYAFLDGAMTYRAAGPLAPSQDGYSDGDRLAIAGLLPDDDAPRRVLLMLADPRPIGPDCVVGPARADAEALARTIASDPDFEATAPVPVTIGGISALQIDVLLAPGATSCPWSEPQVSATSPLLLEHAPVFAGADRARLYLLDLPDGSEARVLALAVITDADSFETVLGFAAPIVESIEFPGGD